MHRGKGVSKNNLKHFDLMYLQPRWLTARVEAHRQGKDDPRDQPPHRRPYRQRAQRLLEGPLRRRRMQHWDADPGQCSRSSRSQDLTLEKASLVSAVLDHRRLPTVAA